MSSLQTNFVLGGSRFDQETFIGRLMTVTVQFDPLKLLASGDELKAAVGLLDQYKRGALPAGTSSEQLWKAQELTAARLHPDTGEQIFLPFCFAAYTPFQPPIILGLLWPGGGVANQMFWQWFNQSYNAAVFFANKNRSSKCSDADVMQSYFGAVATAIGLSTLFVKIGDRLATPLVRSSASFVGCVGAGWASLLMMRRDELVNGVNVKDDEGTVHGKSVVAAREGIAKCCAARVVWNIPATGVMPFVLSGFAATNFAKRNPRLLLPMQTVLITGGIVLGVYPGQALFTQQATIDASKLEPEFRNLKLSDGRPVTELTYNKGL